MKQEIWRDINGYEGLYQVSNLGRVKTVKPRYTKIVFLSPTMDKGYCYLWLYKNKIGKRFSVHRLVALNFIENPYEKYTVNHINGIKDDNRVENLEWATLDEQNKHMVKTGLILKRSGENHCKHKLRESDVIFIKNFIKKNRFRPRKWGKLKRMSEKFNVSLSTIERISYGISWKHVK